MRRDDIDIHEMLNGWVDMILTYMKCETDTSIWYWHTWDVKRMSRDDIDIHEMLNGWYWHTWDVRQMKWDDIDIHEMLNGWVDMILTYMGC